METKHGLIVVVDDTPMVGFPFNLNGGRVDTKIRACNWIADNYHITGADIVELFYVGFVNTWPLYQNFWFILKQENRYEERILCRHREDQREYPSSVSFGQHSA